MAYQGRLRIAGLTMALLGGSMLTAAPLQADDADYALPTRADAARVNDSTVGMLFTHEELFHQMVHDLEDALEHTWGIRIVPVMGKNHVQSIYDLLYLRGVDLAMVRADAIEYVRQEGDFDNIQSLVRSVARVSEERLILIARKEHDSLQALDGQAVGIGLPGTPEYVTGTIALDSLGVTPTLTEVTPLTAIEKLKSGELAAMVYLLRAPDAVQNGGDLQIADAVRRLSQDDELYIVPIPESEAMSSIYQPASLGHEDLPGLVANGDSVATYSVDVILAAYQWSADHPRSKKVTRFIEAFVAELDALKADAYQPVWQRVDLDISTPNVARLATVDSIIATREANRARRAEAERVAEASARAELKAQKAAEIARRQTEITARLSAEPSAADLENLERLLGNLDAFLKSDD